MAFRRQLNHQLKQSIQCVFLCVKYKDLARKWTMNVLVYEILIKKRSPTASATRKCKQTLFRHLTKVYPHILYVVAPHKPQWVGGNMLPPGKWRTPSSHHGTESVATMLMKVTFATSNSSFWIKFKDPQNNILKMRHYVITDILRKPLSLNRSLLQNTILYLNDGNSLLVHLNLYVNLANLSLL